MIGARQIADAQVELWLEGSPRFAYLPPGVIANDAPPEVLEAGEDLEPIYAMALASALCADGAREPDAVPPPLRDAPWDLQLVWFATCSHAATHFGEWRFCLAQGPVHVLTDDEVLEDAEGEGRWQSTLHAVFVTLAARDGGEVIEARWNVGDPRVTLVVLDHDLERMEPCDWTRLLERLLGVSEDRQKLKKHAPVGSTKAHRRAHEIAAYLMGFRSVEQLDNA
ncbi:MAG: hypothetical protein R3B99_05370 [Polyangiales bacterium]|nr:hypothetical protein [Myxococcales bacterium]